MFESDVVGKDDGLRETSPLKFELDKFAGGDAILVHTWDDVVISPSRFTDEAVNWVSVE